MNAKEPFPTVTATPSGSDSACQYSVPPLLKLSVAFPRKLNERHFYISFVTCYPLNLVY